MQAGCILWIPNNGIVISCSGKLVPIIMQGRTRCRNILHNLTYLVLIHF